MWIAHARFIVCRTQVIGLAACCLLVACDRKPPAALPESNVAATQPEQLRAGEKAYEMHCAQCHYAGEAGANVPPLQNSPVLLAEPRATFKVILQGQSNQSVVNGKKFNGIMPAMAYLSDDEVAAVTAYLRERFAGKREAIAAAEVAAERKRLGVE